MAPTECLNCLRAQADKQRLAALERRLYKPRSYPYRGIGGVWLSLVEHLVRDEGVVGSNPITPTNLSRLSSNSANDFSNDISAASDISRVAA
jgi:hypothetical protein